MRAGALYCNVLGHTPLWECLFELVSATANVFYSDSEWVLVLGNGF